MVFILYSREHRGSLSDSLLTRKKLSITQFNSMLNYYHFYCFDERINSFMFILNDMEEFGSEFPTWLEIHMLRSGFDEVS